MFVVITLVAGVRSRPSDSGVSAFNSPTVVHFAISLLVAAILSAPWTALAQTCRRSRPRRSRRAGLCRHRLAPLAAGRAYQPVFEDWLGHAIVPFAAYVTLFVAAILLPSDTTPALFLVGAVTVLLVFNGIHNAWDIVTYIALRFLGAPDEHDKPDDTPARP